MNGWLVITGVSCLQIVEYELPPGQERDRQVGLMGSLQVQSVNNFRSKTAHTFGARSCRKALAASEK